MAAATIFDTAHGRFDLRRPGLNTRSPLQAWDAADLYLLDHLAGAEDCSTLILNDTFGALAVALALRSPVSMVDSYVGRRTAEENLAANGRSGVRFVPVGPVPDKANLVVLKIPRTLSLLEHQLHLIRSACGPGTTIVGAGMVKNVHTSTLQLFEQIVGPTTTSLAKKKARLIHPVFDPELSPDPDPWPRTMPLDNGIRVVVQAGVFAGTKLDVGTRVLLDNLPAIAPGSAVLDLGCGNGIVGTAVAGRTQATVTLVDDSHLAVESAKATFELNHPDQSADFVVGDAGDSLAQNSFDLVLNNPPFHESNAVTDATSWRMFQQSRRVLRPGGELRVVANRHLGYHTKLKRLFGNCETVASTKKFVVLSSLRP